MNIESTLKSLNINAAESINRTIKDVGIQIDLKPDRLEAANRYITALGAAPVTKERTQSFSLKA